MFRLGATGPVYYLVAGRWFTAPGFTGPWTFATPSLPEDFKKIPLEHPRSRVLASVPGTQQAAEGVLLAQVPQTARVNKKQMKAPEVEYQGEPKFEKIEKTKVERAVNTDKSIIKVGDMYYMCFEGVWFMGSSPTGPWAGGQQGAGRDLRDPDQLAGPQRHLRDGRRTTTTNGPPSPPRPMYTGVMVAWGCAVWGSGYYYPPYYGGFYGGYPMYRGYYPTYGYGASYNPWTGAYSRGAVAYGPYGGAGVGARYNPRTGTYSRGAAAYGPYGSRAAGQAYNPRTGAYGQTRQGSSVYGSWGSTAGAARRPVGEHQSRHQPRDRHHHAHDAHRQRSGGGDTDRSGRDSAASRERAAATSTPAGTATCTRGSPAAAGRSNEGGNWANRPTQNVNSTTVDQLNRDYGARTEGRQRTNDYSSYRSSGSSRASSYRSSGGGSRGGSRGGGGRRR